MRHYWSSQDSCVTNMGTSSKDEMYSLVCVCLSICVCFCVSAVSGPVCNTRYTINGTLWYYIMKCLYINLTYNFRRNCTILLNHVIACTYYEINIYVRRNNILHCWYIKVLYVLVVSIMSGDKLAHEAISSCHIGVKWFLKSVFQIMSDKIYFGGKINRT